MNQDLLEAGSVLAASRSVLTYPKAAFEGTWQRASALLARQALELAVNAALVARIPDVEDASMRTRLVCLGELVGHDEAHEAAWLWSRLSTACHHHPYDLAPTGAELGEWIDRIDHFIRQAHDA